MRKLTLFFRRISTGWVALAGLVAFILFTALVLPGQSQKAKSVSGGAGSPDTSFYYSASDLYRMAEAYGEQGRKDYVKARFTFDLVFPIVYGFFLITALSWIAKRGFPTSSRWQLASMVPLGGMLFDYLENLSASIVMLRYPASSGAVAGLAGFFTLLKWGFIGLSFLLLMTCGVICLWRWRKGFLTLLMLSLLLSSCSFRHPAANSNATPSMGSLDLSLPTSTLVVIPPAGEAEATLAPSQSTSEPPAASPTLALPQPDPWDGKGRVTILILGLDYADWENTDRVGPPRSDTMILLTIDPVGKTAGILSIPRDLWVSMPGVQGYHKINTAHRFGDLYNFPGGGPGLAMRTVEELLGIPVNFYARIDFKAFEDFIDELGGVEIDIPSQIKVDPIGKGNTRVLEPGKQLLDGPTALAYARNRNTEGDDFDRSERQQQVILAVRQRVLSAGRLPLLVAKAPALYQTLSAGIQTNLTLKQVIQLAWLAQEIPVESTQRLQIGKDAVTYATAPDGQAIDVPVPERIIQIRNQIFTSSSTGSLQPMTTDDLIAAEYVRIRLINQTGDADLGERTFKFLKEKGLNVIEIVQSDERRPKTRLVDLASNPYTLRSLIDLLHVSPSEIYIQLDNSEGVEMLVYLGEDWANENPLK